jgi:hypothetical protein
VGEQTPRGADRQVIRREGDFWTIVFAGETCRLRDTRGMRHLAHLLRHPHERIAALALERAADHFPGDPVMTAGEPEPVAGERARVNVTRALGVALRRLEPHHPDLARHLRATLRTGAYCVYTPDPRVGIAWEAEGE